MRRRNVFQFKEDPITEKKLEGLVKCMNVYEIIQNNDFDET